MLSIVTGSEDAVNEACHSSLNVLQIGAIRDSELICHKHQIKHIDHAIPIHVRGQIARS